MSYSAGSVTLTVDRTAERELGGEPVEVWDESGSTRIEVTRTDERIDNSTRNGCGHSDVITYALSELPPGMYIVVHRLASGTGDPTNCFEWCESETFDGDEAFVMTLELAP